jgi:antitoxin FitA
MSVITVRSLSDEVHRALRLRAAAHGRSTEAEVRDILARAALPEGRLKIGSELRRFVETLDGGGGGGVELELQREQAPIEPASFE